MAVDDDPRPVYEGEWAKATGQQRSAHAARVHAWKVRNGIPVGQSGKGADKPSGETDRHAADLAVLDAVIAAPKTLASDRIRAVEARQRILNREEDKQREEQHGPLLALHHALTAIPTAERVDALSQLLGIAGSADPAGPAESSVVDSVV